MEEDNVDSTGCTVNKKFLPLKVSYFTLFAGFASLWNFLPLHMKSLGLSPSEIGLINGIPTFLGIISTTLAGGIADRYQIHCKLACCLTIMTTVIESLLFLVPSTHIAVNPQCIQINASSYCSDTQGQINPAYQIIFNNSSSSNCLLYPVLNHIQYTNTSKSTELCNKINTKSESLTLQNSIFNCTKSPSQMEEILLHCGSCTENTGQILNNTAPFIPPVNLSSSYSANQNLFICDSLNHDACDECIKHNENESTHQIKSTQEKFGRTFWIYISIYALASLIMNPTWPLLNALAYASLGNQRNSWGRQRLWGTIGDGLIVFPVSLAMHYYGKGKQPSFVPNFIVFFLLAIIAGMVIWFLKAKVHVQSTSTLLSNLKSIWKIWEIYILLFLAYLFGFYLTAMSTLLPLFITTFPDGNEMIFALAIVFNIIGEVPALFYAKIILSKLGYVKCLYISCMGFSIRFFLYTVINNPWLVLPINLLHGITFGVMYSTVTAYASSLTPPALHGTIQGLVSTITWSIGAGCGSLVAGEMMDHIGARKTFAIFSACSLATLVFYFAYINIAVHMCTMHKAIKSKHKEFQLVSDRDESELTLLNEEDSVETEDDDSDITDLELDINTLK